MRVLQVLRVGLAVCAVVWGMLAGRVAWGAILVMEGNTPVHDGNWPAGLVEVVNVPTRVVHWDGPLGGSDHFGFRGDTAAFQGALDLFGKVNSPELRVVVREGREELSFLREGNDKHVDWKVEVWDPRSWFIENGGGRGGLSRLDPSQASIGTSVPGPVLTVNVAGPGEEGIDWGNVKVPAGLKVVDERATAAGYGREDGSVVRGEVYDMMTMKPVKAKVTLKPTMMDEMKKPMEVEVDGAGHFEVKRVEAGSYQVEIGGAGYVTRVMGVQTGKNTLRQMMVYLSAPMTVLGEVKDTAGKPLAGVKVRAQEVTGADGAPYGMGAEEEVVTDGMGTFALAALPEGTMWLRATKDKLRLQDELRVYKVPGPKVALVMTGTGVVKGKVLKQDGNADGEANVNMNAVVPAGASLVGTWGAGMKVKGDGTFEITGVPPGEYVISSEILPPGEEGADAKRIKVEVGGVVEVELRK